MLLRETCQCSRGGTLLPCLYSANDLAMSQGLFLNYAAASLVVVMAQEQNSSIDG